MPHSGRRPHRDSSLDGLHRGHLAPPHLPHPFTTPLHRHCWQASLPWGSIPKVYIAAVFLFSPIRDLVCIALPFRRRCIVDTPEDEVITAPSQAAALTLVIRPSPPVSPPFQAVVLPMLPVRFVTLALGSSPRQLPQLADTAANVAEGRRIDAL